jgi:hypothetical protein
MRLELSKPFESYVSIEAFPSSGDARPYVLHLRYELDGSRDSGEITWPWEYSRAQQCSDAQPVADTYELRLAQEMVKFRSHVEYELELQQKRLYERHGSGALVLAASEQAARPGDCESARVS